MKELGNTRYPEVPVSGGTQKVTSVGPAGQAATIDSAVRGLDRCCRRLNAFRFAWESHEPNEKSPLTLVSGLFSYN
jgi:hypothetical protein